MRRAQPLFTSLVLACLCASVASAQSTLSAADAKLLEGLLKTTVYAPPAGARRCRLQMPVRTVWGQETFVEREGWVPNSATLKYRLTARCVAVANAAAWRPTSQITP